MRRPADAAMQQCADAPTIPRTALVQSAGAVTAAGRVTGDQALRALELAAHPALKNASRSSQR